MMVVSHLMWDRWDFGLLSTAEFWNPFWRYWQRTTASTFLILVGVSLTLLVRRMPVPEYRPFLRRGLRLFGMGMLVTVVMAATGIGVVDFGILHLIGFAIVAAYPLLRYTWLNLALWLVFFVAGGVVQNLQWPTRWLVPVGITPPEYAAVDYFPILPWFGVVLLGVWLGNWFYGTNGRRWPLPNWGGQTPMAGLEAIGRHSLWIYLLHQPILIAILYVSGLAQF
jgi:uncharacterized membrane protein